MSILSYFKRKSIPNSQSSGANERSADIPYWGNTLNIDFNNPTMPMKIATVYRCIDILGGSVASIGCQIYRKKITSLVKNEITGEMESDGYYVIDQNNPINYLLSMCPNSRLNAFDFFKNAITIMHLTGNVYILPVISGGKISSLILLSPNTVTYDKDMNTYLISDYTNGIYGTYTADEIIHIRNVSMDGGYTGISTITYAAITLGIASAQDSQSSDIFQPGSTSRGFISGDETVTKGMGKAQDAQLSTVGNRVESEIRSGKRILSLPGSMKFNPLSMSPADLNLLQSQEFNVLQICRFFGVHPDKVFYMRSSNYKASENSQTAYLTDTLQPILRKFENEFTIKLLPKSLQGKYKCMFNMDDYYQSDLTSRSAYIEKTINNGIRTVNEWRKKDGYAPVDGGDQTFISCNVAPINSAKIKGEPTSVPKV